MVFEAHGQSFPCTELLLFYYAKVNTVFHSRAPLTNLYLIPQTPCNSITNFKVFSNHRLGNS